MKQNQKEIKEKGYNKKNRQRHGKSFHRKRTCMNG
jgi:hypothetical protein